MRNEEVLHSVKEDGKRKNKRRESEMDDHIKRRNCLLRQVTGGKIEVKSEWKTRKKATAAMDDIGKRKVAGN